MCCQRISCCQGICPCHQSDQLVPRHSKLQDEKNSCEDSQNIGCDYTYRNHSEMFQVITKKAHFCLLSAKKEQGLVSAEQLNPLILWRFFMGSPQLLTADQLSGEASAPHWTPSRASLCVGAIVSCRCGDLRLPFPASERNWGHKSQLSYIVYIVPLWFFEIHSRILGTIHRMWTTILLFSLVVSFLRACRSEKSHDPKRQKAREERHASMEARWTLHLL